MPPAAPDLRPLSIGELVDRAASLWRSNLGALFKFYLAFEGANFAARKLYLLAMVRWFPDLRTAPRAQAVMEGAPGEFQAQAVAAVVVTTLLIAWVLSMSMIASVAATRFIGGQLTGAPSSLRACLRETRTRLATALGAGAASAAYLVFAMLLGLVPGALLVLAGILWFGDLPRSTLLFLGGGLALGLVGLVVAVLWYVLRFAVMTQVVALEDVGVAAALRRSGRLLSGRLGPGVLHWVKVRAAILITLVGGILFAVSLLSGLPELILQLAYGNAAGRAPTPEAVPLFLELPAQLVTVVAQAAFSPLYVAFGALLYLDLRVRKEGLDLELKLQVLAHPAGAPP